MEKHSIRKIMCRIRALSRSREHHAILGKLEIADSFVLLLSVLLIADDEGALWLLLCAAVLHEAGHYLALRACGGKLTRVTLTAAGAVMRYRLRDGRRQRFLIAAAGPCASLLAACLAAKAHSFAFAGANIVLGCFNLLPVWPLDGGAMLYWCAGTERMRRVARGISVLCAAALVPAGGWLQTQGGGIWLLLLAIGLLVQQKACIRQMEGVYLICM